MSSLFQPLEAIAGFRRADSGECGLISKLGLHKCRWLLGRRLRGTRYPKTRAASRLGIKSPCLVRKRKGVPSSPAKERERERASERRCLRCPGASVRCFFFAPVAFVGGKPLGPFLFPWPLREGRWPFWRSLGSIGIRCLLSPKNRLQKKGYPYSNRSTGGPWTKAVCRRSLDLQPT